MADVVKTCANCGNVQATGDFCERCGTRMPPAAPAPPASGAAAAYTAARPSAPAPSAPPPYATQGPYGTMPPPGAPQYGYPPKEPGPWSRLFDFSFQGFVTPATLRTLFVIVLGLIGAFTIFSIVYGALIARFDSGEGVVWIFAGLAVAALWFFLSRVLFELMATVLRIRDKEEGK